MRRSVVLKLLARGKVQMAHRYGRLVSDPVPPAKSRQRRVGKLGPFRRQLLMDSHQIPLALLEKLQDLLPIGFGFLWTLQLRHSAGVDRKSTRLNSSHVKISYAVFCLKKKKKN